MNMKKTALFLSLFFSFGLLFAQTTPENQQPVKKSRLGLEATGGYSMVLGTYGSIDKSNKKSGYATAGWQVQLTFDWMGKKDFGLSLQYTFQKNPLNDTTRNIVPYGWYNGTLGPGAWTNHYLMLGPVFMKQFGKLHVDARIMGGVIVSASDNFKTQNAYDSLKKDVNLGTGFAYEFSAGVGYSVSDHLTFKFNLSLMGGWPTKSKKYGSQYLGTSKEVDPITGIVYYEPIYSAPVEYEIKKVVTTLNPTIGLVYRF